MFSVQRIFFIVALVACGNSYSSPINYDESVSGDLWSFNSFTLDTAGTHNWTGSTYFLWNTALPQWDWDNFSIDIASGLELTSVSASISNVVNGGTIYGSFGALLNTFEVRDGFTVVYEEDVAVVPSYPLTMSSSLPVQDGIYQVGPFGTASACSSPNCRASWDWSFSLTLQSVPVPAAFWLLASGLVGLIGFARRKKA